MEEISLISMSAAKNRAEIVHKTCLPDGTLHSRTRHIHRESDGTWSGLSSDEVIRSHNKAGERLRKATHALNEANQVLKQSEATHKKATIAAAKDPSEKVRAKANASIAALKAAMEAKGLAEHEREQAASEKAELEKKSPLRMRYHNPEE